MKMTKLNKKIQRRRFLQGSGAMVAMPYLELFASPAQACGEVAPRFMAIYMANGTTQDDFFSIAGGNGSNYASRYIDWRKNGGGKAPITRSGSAWNPNKIVRPYQSAGIKEKIAVYNHLSNNSLASSNSNGVHATAACSYLTCQGAKATKSPIQMGGQSFDYMLSEHYKGTTSLKSMHLSSAVKHGSGNGSHVTYSDTLTWDKDGKAVRAFVSPRDAFNEYFGNAGALSSTEQVTDADDALTKSVLDFVLEDANELVKHLGQADKERMDEYLTGLRELEEAIEVETISVQCDVPSENYPHYVQYSQQAAVPGSYDRPKHIDMNFDMMYLALKCGLTNVLTFIVDEERGEFKWPSSISTSPTEYHGMSHRQPDNFAKVNTYMSGKIAGFLKRLDGINESNGLTILDNSVVMAGSGMNGPVYYPNGINGPGDPGDDHQRHALPIVFSGSGGGKLKTNQEICFPPGKRFSNVYQTLATHVYCTPQKKFANSNGVIDEMLL